MKKSVSYVTDILTAAVIIDPTPYLRNSVLSEWFTRLKFFSLQMIRHIISDGVLHGSEFMIESG